MISSTAGRRTFGTIGRWLVIVVIALLGVFSIVAGARMHSDRIGRYDEASSVARASFDADIAFAASISLFGFACLVSAWMAFKARQLDAARWAAASQTTREILAGVALYAGALTLASQIPDGDASALLGDIGRGLAAFLALGAWILIVGPGKASYVSGRGLIPTYELSVEAAVTRKTGTEVTILRPAAYALALLALMIANVIAAIYFSNDRVLSTSLFLIDVSKSQLLIVALVLLSVLDCLYLAIVWRIRRCSAAQSFDLLVASRPLIFVNSILLLTESWNLFAVPVFSVAASAIAVAVVTAIGPGLLLTWFGPTLTRAKEVAEQARHDPHA